MIFRLSQKLATKIKVTPIVCLPLAPNPFADWSAHLFTPARAQYIIIVNTPSLYSIILHGRGITDDGQFLDAALREMRVFLADDGNKVIFRKLVALASGEVHFSRALNRAVTGSMNDLISCAKFHLIQGKMLPSDTASSLNDVPMSYLGHKSPKEAFKRLKADGRGQQGVRQ